VPAEADRAIDVAATGFHSEALEDLAHHYWLMSRASRASFHYQYAH
jgi:hypothetical protein